MTDNAPPTDEKTIRCPRLGHQVSFSFCRMENNGLPCFKTLDCWYVHFPVEAYLKSELSPEQWKKALSRPSKNKMASLLELIEQARKAKAEAS
ncbi:MAG: hypothetical protein B6240_09205 [Desulfobacteraceae bacterium 4572_87]|nr:MAG: hypothetical protein B6240_09205 [Desulfobacteraceae bacterium 4572_87]